MKIKLSKTVGYCMGVRRAMDMAFEELSSRNGPVFSYGELIHNQPALDLLSHKGLKLWQAEEQGTVIIRAHGLAPPQRDILLQSGLKIRDATCPKVLAVQQMVSSESKRGCSVIIWGAKEHPEVTGIYGHAFGRCFVVQTPEDIDGLPDLEDVLFVSQTTQETEKWPEIKQAVLNRWPTAIVKNTICQATQMRQNHLRELAAEVEALVVIGGKNSGNTRRLVQIAEEYSVKTLAVETEKDLDPKFFHGVKTIGIAAGASTSTWQIGQILQAIRALGREGELSLSGVCNRVLRALVLSNIYAAAAIAGLTVMAAKFLSLPVNTLLFSAVFFFTTGLHLMRDFTQGQTVRFNDPDRMSFMAKYKRPLILLCIGGLLSGIGAALMLSKSLAAVFILMAISALIYQLLRRPSFYNNSFLSHLRPLAKPIMVALCWAALLTAAPIFIYQPITTAVTGSLMAITATALIFFGSIFTLALMYDVQSAQGDRIFGRPTLISVYGVKKTRYLIILAICLWSASICLAVLLGCLPKPALALNISGPAYMGLLIRPLFKNQGLYGFRFEAAMFGSMMLSSLAALCF